MAPDVVIVGAGAAGLAAARALHEAGRAVLVVEARDRIGGRIWTHRDGDLPLELGAEFVQGVPPEIEEIERAGGLHIADVGGDAWVFRDGRLERRRARPRALGALFERLRAVAAGPGPDMTFAEFLERHGREPRFRDALAPALAYVQGYHAARPERIGIRTLVFGDAADATIDGDRTRRVLDGYDRVVAWLRDRLPAGAVRLNTVVTGIRWQPGRVQIEARTAGGDALPSLSAPRAVVTLPLGVLKAPPHVAGAVRFEPALPEKAAALDRLEMGTVTKVVLRFRERFWVAGDAADGAARTGLRWVSAPGRPIPTWWTIAPLDAPVLVGWAGGPAGEALAQRSDAEVRALALEEVAHLFGLDGAALDRLVVSWHRHNWHHDPFARGAYSYAGVDGREAQRALARPVAGTLYFAGEATEYNGHFSTVHGALATGYRAAREVLAHG